MLFRYLKGDVLARKMRAELKKNKVWSLNDIRAFVHTFFPNVNISRGGDDHARALTNMMRCATFIGEAKRLYAVIGEENRFFLQYDPSEEEMIRDHFKKML